MVVAGCHWVCHDVDDAEATTICLLSIGGAWLVTACRLLLVIVWLLFLYIIYSAWIVK